MDEKMVEEVKAAVELSLEQLIEKAADPVMDMLLKEIADKIPGGVDDMVIEKLAPHMKPMLKSLMLKEIEKISAKV